MVVQISVNELGPSPYNASVRNSSFQDLEYVRSSYGKRTMVVPVSLSDLEPAANNTVRNSSFQDLR